MTIPNTDKDLEQQEFSLLVPKLPKACGSVREVRGVQATTSVAGGQGRPTVEESVDAQQQARGKVNGHTESAA